MATSGSIEYFISTLADSSEYVRSFVRHDLSADQLMAIAAVSKTLQQMSDSLKQVFDVKA